MRGFIVGLGKMGRMHARAMLANGIDVVAGFDSSQTTAESFTRETGISTKPNEQFQASLSLEQPEFVSIATTTPSRFDLVRGLMDHQSVKFIFVEKPFSSSLSQMAELVSESQRCKKTLLINHQMMFLPHFVIIRDFVLNGRIGQLVSVNIAGSNFGLANKVSHYFEAFRYLTGSGITRVSAALDEEPIGSHRGPEFRDFSGRLTAWNIEEQILYVDFSLRSRTGIFVTYSFEFGKVFVDEIGGRVFLAEIAPGFDKSRHFPYSAQQDLEEILISPSRIEFGTEQVVRAAISGEEFPGIETIENSMKALLACVHSSRLGGKHVELNQAGLSAIWDEEFSWS